MTKKLFVLVCCFALLLCGISAAAEGAYAVTVDDEAGLLSPAEARALAGDMAALTEYGDAVFWSTERSGTADVLAEQYFDAHIDTSRSHSGVIFLIDMHTREVLIFTRGLLEERVGRAGAYAITDSVYSLASHGSYYECARQGFGQVLRLAQGQRIFSPMRVICTLLLALSLGFLAAYLIILRSSVAQDTAKESQLDQVAVHMRIDARHLLKSVRTLRTSDSGGGGGFRGGGGGGGGFSGGGGGGSSGSHRF